MTGGPPAVDSSVLIVIPCLNEATSLPALLTLLTAENPDARIVVADGGSTDGSRAIIAQRAAVDPAIVLLDNPERIQSAGINRAVTAFGADAQWLVRIDAHCTYPAGYVAALLAAATRHQAASVVVPMVSRGNGCFQTAAAAAQNSKIGTGGSPHRHVGTGRYVDHGHHALMDLAKFRAVGGYRSDMSHNEDAELDLRIGKAGGRIWLEPGLALGYFPRDSALGLARQYWNYGRGRARTLALHRLRPKLRQMLPLIVPPALALALLAPWWPLCGLPLLGWAGLCLGAGVVIGIRERNICAAASGFAAMIMHTSWGCGFLWFLLTN